MAEIRPFRGVRYNQSVVKDLSTVICPPCGIISPQLQQELYWKSDSNFVRVEFPQDIAEDDKYARSAATLEEWLKQGILKIDEAPAIYLHDHYFAYQRKEHRRRNIIARVRLEEWDKMVVRPHELTLAKSRSDRLSLLWACQANTSPILALFEDKEQRVSSLLARQEQDKPVISSSGGGESHYVWAITEPEVINQIGTSLAQQPLYIADGHHRYESALIYRRERYAYSPSAPADAPFNFVMMALVDFADPGLIILPPHRLIRGLSTPALNGLMAKLTMLFEVEELPLSLPDVWQQVDDLLVDAMPAEANQVRLVVFGLEAGRIFVLRLRDFDDVSRMMPYFHSELYKRLDVSIVDHVILEKLLELSSDKEEGRLSYSYDREDAVNRVLGKEYQLAFLLSPVESRTVKAIADAGDRMPRKSTYFYPKAPAGLVLNRLV